ncbi:hypothetical protein [Haloferula sp. BvORR071]|uniref:hypothetical protein n=1 Tax=Haloferula sp. BvORR071 TaxID=1396141 RepID=UPI00054D7B2A|nr:hypothetical protein [Haloferula sp. BvORR071]
MVSRLPALPQAIASACLCLLIASPARAAEAGAWEAFPSKDNSDAWTVLDYSVQPDGDFFYPQWFDDQGDGFAYFYHTNNAPLIFFTDVANNAGGGKLVGNYLTENIAAIHADILIDSLPDFDGVDCIVYANGPAGERVYYSEVFFDTDFPESGWYSLRFSFTDKWYYINTLGAFTAVSVTPQMLANIEVVGFRFFPKTSATGELVAAIDNIKLEPKLTPPPITTATTGGNFSMSFTPGKGVTCSVEKQDPAPLFGWSVIAEAFDVTGTTPFTYSTPIDTTQVREIFRVSYDPIYTSFVTPPVGP